MDTRTPPLPTPVYSTPGPGAPNPWAPPTSGRDFGFAGGAVIVLAAIVAGCIAMVHGRDPLTPIQWDPRVAPLVSFVEKTRGYTFKHPVEVQFLTADAYRARATKGATSTADDKAFFQDEARFFRALGLVGGDVDLAAEQDEISDSGTLAFYSPDDHKVYVRGVDLTPSLRVTLAHELTHALQDQIFSLNLSRASSDGEAFALRALAEGDAIRVEDAYFDTLTDDEKTQVSDQQATDVVTSKALNSDRAPVLLALFGAPYELGVPFVRLLASIPGGLDRAFRSPPKSEENVFDPASFLDRDEPLHVTAPKVPPGAHSVASMGSEVGVVMWYLLIASHTDQQQALTAVEGWGGDAMTVYDRAGLLCTAMVFRGDTSGDADEMQTALSHVITSLSANAPQLGRSGGDITLTLCDPGATATVPKIEASGIFAAPTVRSLLLGVALQDPKVTPRQAQCAVDKTLAPLDDAHLVQVLGATSENDPAVRQVLTDLDSFTTSCR